MNRKFVPFCDQSTAFPEMPAAVPGSGDAQGGDSGVIQKAMSLRCG
jgi:hypothetical protein